MSGESSSGRKVVTSTGGPPSIGGPVGFQTPSPGSRCGKTGLIGGGRLAASASLAASLAATATCPKAGRIFTVVVALTGGLGFAPPPQPAATTAAATAAMSAVRLVNPDPTPTTAQAPGSRWRRPYLKGTVTGPGWGV